MKLLPRYATETGLRIGKQYLAEAFYPLPFDRYATIQAGSGMAAKNYPFYNEVLALILPALEAAGIKVVQLGGKDDPALRGCYHLQGQTNLHQSNYVLARSLCHIGNDSWLSHRGGALGIPLVISFGPTTVANHSPYQFGAERSVFIESHRFGRRATFAAQESPSTIAVIPPEQIANAALRLLLPDAPQLTRKSVYIGEAYNQHIVELVPNCVVAPQIQVPGALILRMDLAADDAATINAADNALLGNLQVRPCAIITNRELNLNHLAQLKGRIAGLRVEVDKVSAAWIKAVKRLGVQVAFFSTERDPDKLARLRLDLYDACLFDQYIAPTREDFVKGTTVYLNDSGIDSTIISDKMRFTTYRLMLSDNKVYLSEAHWRAGRSTPSAEQNTDTVIDSPVFWEGAAHLYCFLHCTDKSCVNSTHIHTP